MKKSGYPGRHNIHHLGFREVNSFEFLNVDSCSFSHIKHLSDVTKLGFLRLDSLIGSFTYLGTLVYIETLLLEWKRVLKKGCSLRIWVPNFDSILKIHTDNNNSIETIWRTLIDGQDYPDNFHYSVFNFKYISKLLLKAGFTRVSKGEENGVDHHNFDDWTFVDYVVSKKVYNISLNFEAIN